MIQILSNLYDARYAELRSGGWPALDAHVEALFDALSKAHALIDSSANTIRDITLERRQAAGDWD